MNKDMTELIWYNLFIRFKNKVDAYAISDGATSKIIFFTD
jgi:hypothetical protein